LSFLIGHPRLLGMGLRVAVGTQTAANLTLQVMGNLVDSQTPGAAGRVMKVADATLAIADPLLRKTRAKA
jgi:menaquinone-9 beta-reductase